MMANTKVEHLVDRLLAETTRISEERRSLLDDIASKMAMEYIENGSLDVLFICTHNSRRSQLAELWLAIGAKHFGLPGLRVWSGGTDVTSFNYRMVFALQHRGFELYRSKEGDNPHYRTRDLNEKMFFSKRYDDEFNPGKNFMAITVCDDADEGCPMVHGAVARFHLPYVDPKAADDTDKEIEVYIEKVDEIGREILYCLVRTTEHL